MENIGRRAAAVVLAASAMTGVAAGAAIARSGGARAAGGGDAVDTGSRIRLVQTQSPQTPEGTPRRPCPKRQGGEDGTTPSATPSDTSV